MLTERVVITAVDDRQVVVRGVPSAVDDPLAAGEESTSVASATAQFSHFDRGCGWNREQVSIFDIHASIARVVWARDLGPATMTLVLHRVGERAKEFRVAGGNSLWTAADRAGVPRMSRMRRIDVQLHAVVWTGENPPLRVIEEEVLEQRNLNQRTCARILRSQLVVVLNGVECLKQPVVDGCPIVAHGFFTELVVEMNHASGRD